MKKLKKSRFRDFRFKKIVIFHRSQLNFWNTCPDSQKWLYYLLVDIFLDNVKNFCDYSMILWKMAGNLLTNGLNQSPPDVLGLSWKENKILTANVWTLNFKLKCCAPWRLLGRMRANTLKTFQCHFKKSFSHCAFSYKATSKWDVTCFVSRYLSTSRFIFKVETMQYSSSFRNPISF